MTSSQLEIYLRLHHDSRLGPARFSQLIKQSGTVAALLNRPREELAAQGLDADALTAIKEAGGASALDRLVQADLNWQQQSDHHLLCYESADYPALLREISRPPPMIYLWGNPQVLSLPQFAIVGSRRASHGARQNAFWLAKELSQCGFSICSGLAHGIDSQAHLGALAGSGFTLAVMGTGIDRIYPDSNRGLAQRIADLGALVSEFPLGSLPLPAHFPQRNRIISGLSLGVLIAEANQRSGSLITARYALEQNREVFALPGPISNPGSQGCHELIRQGARLVESPQDILDELDSLVAAYQLQKENRSGGRVELPTGLNPDSMPGRVLAALEGERCHPDQLQQRLALDWPTLQSALMDLELRGLIARQDGWVQPTA